MTANNKVLTVSYGTFSCTLEGFEDSFETMKLIAEYFRDLASEDRYFGAEPPAPDTEVLAKLAEREIARHVNARNEDGKIHLSAAAPVAAAAAADVVEDSAETLVELDDIDDVAVDETAEIAEDVPALEDVDLADTQFEFARADEDDLEDIEVAEIAEDAQDAELDAPTIDDEESVKPTRTATSVAERLQRIRSVVSKTNTSAPVQATDEYSEDEHATDADTASFTSIADAFGQSAGEEDAPDTSFDEEFENELESNPAVALDDEDANEPFILEDDEEEADELSAILQSIETEATADEDAPAEDDDQTVMDEVDTLIAGFVSETEDASVEIEETDVASAEAETLEADVEDIPEASETLTDADEADTNVAEAVQEQPRPRRARVLKIKSADLSRAFDAGKIEEATAEPTEKLTAMSSLSSEDEAELTAQLEEIEATDANDISADAEHVESGAFDDDTVVMQELPPIEELISQADSTVSEDDSAYEEDQEVEFETDVDRLMDKADAEMDEPETKKSRNAFQALKAAVAARKADIGLGGGAEAEREETKKSEEYRSDLAQVVKSDRTETADVAEAAEEAPKRPAPLRLVAEQRVDGFEEEMTEAVETVAAARQINETKGAEKDDADFTDYVEKLGAHELPDLLEAAASYLAHVEGKEQFSRPQLMAKVRLIAGADYSREAGLRSFGQLLREGKIEKIRGGRFTVTPSTGFVPDERVAG